MSPTAIHAFVMILTFGAVFLFVEHGLRVLRQQKASAGAINLRLKLIGEGRDRLQIMQRLRKKQSDSLAGVPGFLLKPARKLDALITAAQLPMPFRQVVLLISAAVGGIFVCFVFLVAFGGMGLTAGVVELAAVLSIAVGAVIPLMLLSRRAQKLRDRVQEQFPVALDIFVRGLRSGHPISSALSMLAQEMEDPIGSEFGLIVDEISYGADLQTALIEFAARWDNEDIHMFVVCLSVQNETGGNLAEILDNLSKVIRDRASMFMKVRALSSEGRATAKVLTILPIITFVAMFAINPAFYLEYARTPAFIIGFSGLIGLYLTGMLWIRKLVDLRV